MERLRFRLDEEGWRLLLKRLDRLGYRAALVGPEGSGKTTLLEELEERLERAGWGVRRFRLTLGERRLSREAWREAKVAGPTDILSVDGAEQLSRWWWRLLERAGRRAGGLVITSHRAGLLPTLHEHRTSEVLLADLVGELLEAGDLRRVEGRLGRLFEEHRGNLRECLRALYDQWSISSAS